MLLEASCKIEITRVVGSLVEVNCVCHVETEDDPYELTIWEEVEAEDLDAYLSRCYFLFQGLIELAGNVDDPGWAPSSAANFLLSMIEAVDSGSDFNIMA